MDGSRWRFLTFGVAVWHLLEHRRLSVLRLELPPLGCCYPALPFVGWWDRGKGRTVLKMWLSQLVRAKATVLILWVESKDKCSKCSAQQHRKAPAKVSRVLGDAHPVPGGSSIPASCPWASQGAFLFYFPSLSLGTVLAHDLRLERQNNLCLLRSLPSPQHLRSLAAAMAHV